MANPGDDWNSMMQSKPVRVALDIVCAVITGYYAISGVFDLIRPSESYQLLIEQIGSTGFYALTGVRILVCVWVCVTFARNAVKTLQK